MIVAIDGPAGVGKSTIASRTAEKFNLFNLNSGNFYRSITLKCLNKKLNMDDVDQIIATAENCNIEIRKGEIYLDNINVDNMLHTSEVDEYVAALSAIIPVRNVVNEKIRKISSNLDLVAEGRDMTTVVFPNADIKFYLDASSDARAERRFKQNVSNLSLEEIKDGIEKRDHIDKNKSYGKLQISKDAIYLDTSDLTLEQVYERVVDNIARKLKTQENLSDMADINNAKEDTNQSSMQEQYLQAMDQIEEGQLVEGVVVQLDGDNAYIDIGYKSEGKIPLSDFSTLPKINDTVEVVLINREGKNGQLVVSKKKADAKKIWKDLKDAFEESRPIKGKVISVIKGGFEVELGPGIKAFVPISQIDTVRVEKPEQYVGLETEFLVEKLYQERRTNIVLSRRRMLEQETEKNRAYFFENVSEGDIVEGEVKSFTSFGAFIDLGGFDGLLHINDMGWGHVTKPKDFVKKNDRVQLKVIQIDQENKKINLSLRELTPNPWDHFETHYHRGDIIIGKVTKLADFGAFIELEQGIEGLAHISELSWVKRIKHPKEVLTIGQDIEVMVLDYDLENQKISLGVKQVMPNPWDTIEEKFPVGTKMTKPIIKVINSGAFIEMEEGIEGFLHIDDYSWTQKIKNPSSVLKEGEEIEVVIINVNPHDRRIKLGVKQLSDDPWNLFQQAHPKGSIVEGEISGKTDFGIFVKIQDIEGLIHKTNLLLAEEEESIDDALAKKNVGDTIKAVVTEIQPGKKKLSLSEKELKKQEERKEISRYLHEEDGDDAGKFTLGDMIK